jgi:hypothetical protein
LGNTFSAEQQQVVGEEDPQMCVCPPRRGTAALFRVLSSSATHRLKYIEAELAKRRGTAAPGQEEGGGPGSKLTHASLYEVPPELRAGPLGGGAAPADDGAGAWLTGIQEVALPMTVKLKVRRWERGQCCHCRMPAPVVLAHISPHVGDTRFVCARAEY